MYDAPFLPRMLKWHKSFDTAVMWTLAGGVTADEWPEWIRPLEDY